MAKSHFDPEAKAVWNSLLSSKGYLSSARIENISDILEREIGLRPVMVRYGENFGPWEGRKSLLARKITQADKDGWCSLYYHPVDCENATGSRADNFLAWANQLLGYGRKSHDFAPYMQPPEKVMEDLIDRGIFDSEVTRTRFLSLELVCFYIGAQTSTWGDAGRILAVKDYMRKQGITALGIDPDDQEIDVDNLMEDNIIVQPRRPVKTSLPKKAQGLLDYNPKDALANKPAATPVVAEGLSEEELETHIQVLQAALEKKKADRLKAKNRENAKKGVIVAGEVWIDKGQWATIRMVFPDGSQATYYHEHFTDKSQAIDVDEALAELIDG